MLLQELLDGFSDDLDPVRQLAIRLSAGDSRHHSNVFELGHRPQVGPEAFAIRLYTPLPEVRVAWYEVRFRFKIPKFYRSILGNLNGLFAFEFSLFGVPPSMAAEPAVLDRSKPQPLDLASANSSWKRSFAIDPDLFYFGGGRYSHDENVGYFLNGPSVYAYRRNGKELHVWSSFRDFLSDELKRAEDEYPRCEEFVKKVLAEVKNGPAEVRSSKFRGKRASKRAP